MSETRRLTMTQALISLLKQQYVERDGIEQPFFAGIFGMFGPGVTNMMTSAATVTIHRPPVLLLPQR